MVILVMLMLPYAIPTIALDSNEGMSVQTEVLAWKTLIAIGRVNTCMLDKIIVGYVVIGFHAGEIIALQRIYIEFQGIPLVISNGLLYMCIIYKPAPLTS